MPQLIKHPQTVAALWLVIGVVAVAAVSVPGLLSDALRVIASPPALVRAFLAAVAVVGGLALLRRALLQIESNRTGTVARLVAESQPGKPLGGLSSGEVAAMVRGVRYAFLAAAALAAAAGWILGEALPLLIALVIAGVDLAETSFLLLVALGRRSG